MFIIQMFSKFIRGNIFAELKYKNPSTTSKMNENLSKEFREALSKIDIN